jgi:hypothetical protein
LLGSYDFTGSPPYQERKNLLPPLVWTPGPPSSSAGATESNGQAWLSTGVPAESLMRELMKTGQFTIHIVCAPAAGEDVNGRLVAFSKSAGDVNFLLREEGQSLVFRLRNPLSTRRALLGLAWYIPGAFEPGKRRDIIASYDGADEFVYLDGIRVDQEYRLSPAASLIHRVRYIEPAALEAYVAVYETLIFLPAGVLIGIALRNSAGWKLSGRWMLILGWAVPAVLLELFLAALSGRRIWAENIVWSLVFGLAGVALSNADQRHKVPSGQP